jgi:NADPH:quinone reductase-like Zn-dependent oxidoreductase
MDDVRALVERGVFRPVLGPRFALDRIAQAHAMAEDRRAQGSVVVTVARA